MAPISRGVRHESPRHGYGAHLTKLVGTPSLLKLMHHPGLQMLDSEFCEVLCQYVLPQHVADIAER